MTLINTHTLFKELVASGMPEKQAEVVSNAALGGRNTDNLATKDQVGILVRSQSDIKTDLALMKADIINIKQTMATKTDLAELRAEVHEVKTDIKWIMALLVGVLGLLIKSTFF